VFLCLLFKPPLFSPFPQPPTLRVNPPNGFRSIFLDCHLFPGFFHIAVLRFCGTYGDFPLPTLGRNAPNPPSVVLFALRRYLLPLTFLPPVQDVCPPTPTFFVYIGSSKAQTLSPPNFGCSADKPRFIFRSFFFTRSLHPSVPPRTAASVFQLFTKSP